MPANRNIESVYLDQRGTFDDFNVSSLYKPGELGARAVDTVQRQYQLVQLDSGATSATGVGVVAANQLAFWKDRSTYKVTNDWPQAVGGQGANSQFRNSVAGIFRAAITAGNYCWILQRGFNINVATKASTYVAGDWVVADSTASKAQADAVTAGTAPGVKPIGVANGARSGANVPVDLDLLPGIE